MPRHRLAPDLDMPPSASSARPIRRRGDVDPVTRSVLNLQRLAGNRAVAAAMGDARTNSGGVRARVAQLLMAQRQKGGGSTAKAKAVKKPPIPPQWLQDAQAIVNDMAKTDKLMGHVVLKKYSDVNKTLQKAGFGAWTNSATEIFVRDPFSPGANRKDKSVLAQAEMIIRFELQHEANHVHQFAQAGGPPTTWQKMLEYEQEAYTNDLTFLQGPGKSIITDVDLHASITSQITNNLAEVNGLLNGIAKLPKKTNLERHLWAEMKKLKLIPGGSKLDPTALYKQP